MSVDPTQQLADERQLVLMVVEAMEAEVAFVEATDIVHAERVAQMVDFTRNFTDGCHHSKEEDLLFPLLEERDPSAGGTVSVLLTEHQAGRECMRAIDVALPEVESSAEARSVVAENLRLYAFLLRLHIGKEDTVLFPLTEKLLNVSELELLAAEFDRVEGETGAAVHEHYHQVAHALAETPA